MDIPRRRSSLRRDALLRLARNRLAIFGAGVLLLFIAMALSAPLVARYPVDSQIFTETPASVARTGWEPTISAATCFPAWFSAPAFRCWWD
jgi:hypothetical protein